MSDGVFDAEVAARYDADHGGTDPAMVAQTVDALANLADGGGALEFAIGTGRIALPLAAKGVPVSGIELSAAMVAEMRKKPGGADIPVVIGDMCEVRSEGTFSLVFWVFNTIDNLTTQDAQVACFQNAAAHLDPGGRFVIETQLPPLQRLPFGETRLPFAHEPDHWGVDEFDVTTQSYSSHHLWIKDGQAQHLSVPFRYAWPSEMDLMARIAGMTLEHRWADWDRSLFTKDSTKHVSVWRKL
ncbi:class I SAM-dependent DNA methyltransferase [Shimia sp. MIT910701]|uniref:class I SAM-dependent DNA methyltransferase n=1 Tax=Shimia sp. MIT910701 TaxID=3096987 RepID=UPI00399AB60F